MSTIPPNDFALIESLVGKLPRATQEDARNLFQGWSAQIAKVSGTVGVTQGSDQQNAAPPPQGSIAVEGSNGTFTVTITPPKLTQPATLWNRVSYSTVKGFTSGVTVLEPTTATSIVLNLPGRTLFFRLESSFNKQVWNQAILASQSAIEAGLVSSAATSDGGAFNQTNLGVVTSVAVGATAAVEIQGAAGPLTSMPTLKGGAQGVLPAAVIVGVPPGSTQFVGRSRQGYVLRPTLGSLLEDGITPIGKVSVVGTGTPVPPVIVPIISGGQIIGYNVTFGGSGASADYVLALATFGPGTGATFGAQTIVGGVLISVAPGNPGTLYPGGTTVVVSGGVFPGAQGGGTAAAGNGGRLTNV
jgi:hypothetical protein